MKIRSLHLEHIGPFAELDIDFPATRPGIAEIHLLTGPNGSGKSTLLYAMAAAFAVKSEARTLVLRRFKDSEGSPSAELTFEDNECALYRRHGGEVETQRLGRGGQSMGMSYRSAPFEIYCTNKCPLRSYFWLADSLQPGRTDPRAKAEFAAVAYSGERSLPEKGTGDLESGPRARFNPLENALAFKSRVSDAELSPWIMTTLAREALALVQNKKEEALRHRSTITLLESILSDLTGDAVRLVLDSSPMELKVHWKGQSLSLDLLPDGLRAVFAWVGDLLMRLDLLPWVDETPLDERSVVVFLDEIDIHLHPAWQRRILPVVQKVFKQGQFFISTHSPFVVGSVSDAYVYRLGVVDGHAGLIEREASMAGSSYRLVTDEIFGIDSEFDVETQKLLSDFYHQRDRVFQGDNAALPALKRLARRLGKRSEELSAIVGREINQLIKRTGKEISV